MMSTTEKQTATRTKAQRSARAREAYRKICTATGILLDIEREDHRDIVYRALGQATYLEILAAWERGSL